MPCLLPASLAELVNRGAARLVSTASTSAGMVSNAVGADKSFLALACWPPALQLCYDAFKGPMFHIHSSTFHFGHEPTDVPQFSRVLAQTETPLCVTFSYHIGASGGNNALSVVPSSHYASLGAVKAHRDALERGQAVLKLPFRSVRKRLNFSDFASRNSNAWVYPVDTGHHATWCSSPKCSLWPVLISFLLPHVGASFGSVGPKRLAQRGWAWKA